MEFSLSKLVEDSFSIDKKTYWLKFKTDKGSYIAFWGEPNNPNRNIVSLRHQLLPLMLTIDDIDLVNCMPSDNEKSKYKLILSVPSNIPIEINPTL